MGEIPIKFDKSGKFIISDGYMELNLSDSLETEIDYYSTLGLSYSGAWYVVWGLAGQTYKQFKETYGKGSVVIRKQKFVKFDQPNLVPNWK